MPHHLNRRALLAGVCGGVLGGFALAAQEAPVLPPLGMELSDELMAQGAALLKKYPSIDVHAHPGLTFIRGEDELAPSLAPFLARGSFENQAVADMKAGGLTAASFAAVSDIRVLSIDETGAIVAARAFEHGEAWADYRNQISNLQLLVDQGVIAPVLDPSDIIKAHASGEVGGIFTSEGGDFLEGRLERLQMAYDDGIRIITIVHYHIGDIGDIQTAPPRYNGLTAFGEDVVREMNRIGIIIDLAHATYGVVKKATEITTKPVILSHSNLLSETVQHPRLISKDHARLIAGTGGVIGAWPAGIGISDFAGYIEQILRLVDVVGVDHVSIGTDMDANYKPVFYNYRQLPQVPAALMASGMHEQEIAKILGGNFMRVFEAVTA